MDTAARMPLSSNGTTVATWPNDSVLIGWAKDRLGGEVITPPAPEQDCVAKGDEAAAHVRDGASERGPGTSHLFLGKRKI